MLQKNLPFLKAIYIIFIRLWLDLIALIKFVVDGKLKDAWAVSRAHQYFFLNFIKNANKRRRLTDIENKKGVYKKVIIWEFIVNKIQKFSDLSAKNFY